MHWPYESFRRARLRASMLAFVLLFIPVIMIFLYWEKSGNSKIGFLLLSISILHVIVSISYAYPRLFLKYIPIISNILGEDIIQSKGFNSSKQKLSFVILQGIGAAGVSEIARFILLDVVNEFIPMQLFQSSIAKGIFFSIITTTLISVFLWIGITRSREKLILDQQWKNED